MHYFLAVLVVLGFGVMLLLARRFASTSQFVGVLFMWGVPMLLFGVFGIFGRAAIAVSGTVVESTTACVQPHNNRCVTTYRIAPDSTASRTTYKAGPNDQSLKRQLPVGTQIHKEPWSLGYSVDGTVVSDFPWAPYAVLIAFGSLMTVSGAVRAPAAYRAWHTEYSERVRTKS